MWPVYMSLTFHPLHVAKKDTSLGRSTTEFYGHRPTLFFNNLIQFSSVSPLWFSLCLCNLEEKIEGVCVMLPLDQLLRLLFSFLLGPLLAWAHILSPTKICGLKYMSSLSFWQCMP